MRAREFIVKEQVASAVGSVVAPAVTQGIKQQAKDLAVKGFDKYYDWQNYSKGANTPLPDPIGAAVGASNNPKSAGDFVRDQAATNLIGRGLQNLGTQGWQLAYPRLGALANTTGKVLRTGTGPVGTGAALLARHGDAGKAYGPHADYRPGREDWMRKHGYDPNNPGDYQRSLQDYEQAKKNYGNLPLTTRINQKLNPFVDDDSNDDAIMKYRSTPAQSKE